MKKNGILLLLTMCLFCSNILAQSIEWVHSDTVTIPNIPVSKEVGGAFVGLSNDVLIVAGGSYFDRPLWENGNKQYSDSIFVCTKKEDKYTWRYVGKLPFRIAHGAMVNTDDGVICLGGENEYGKSDKVWRMCWNSELNKVTIDYLASLPVSCSYPSAAILDNAIYLAGGKNEGPLQNFWKLELSDFSKEWVDMPSVPWGKRFGPLLLKQSNGDNDCLFLFGGRNSTDYLKDVYCYNPKQAKDSIWKRLPDMPRPVLGAPAIAIGKIGLLIFSGSDGHDMKKINKIKNDYHFTPDIFVYNTTNGASYSIGNLQLAILNTPAVLWEGQIVIAGGEIRPSVRTSTVITINIDKEFNE
ncbi:MAG: kelch repeat-containing protein [Dysgonomonas sp.]|nr:kelch repeat-containing protein [Dysgonomonas sp.]